jgi:predicted RNA binding protein YcfA (HicA-like mRNA interferase family)
MHSAALIKELMAAGWELVRTRGSHHQFRKDGRVVTIPHPKKDLGVGLVKAIRKQAGLPTGERK